MRQAYKKKNSILSELKAQMEIKDSLQNKIDRKNIIIEHLNLEVQALTTDRLSSQEKKHGLKKNGWMILF